MKELKFLSIFCISVMLFTSFTPFAYAWNFEIVEDGTRKGTLGMLTKLPVAGGSGCEGEVFTTALNWTDYQNLLALTAQEWDAFGNPAQAEFEESLENAGLTDDISVLQTQNQFLIGEGGKTFMVYDLLKNRLLDSDSARACYLSRVVTTGYMSYATKVDENIRVCSQYPDIICEVGKLSTEDVEQIDRAEEALEKAVKVDRETQKPLDEINWNEVKMNVDSETRDRIEEKLVEGDYYSAIEIAKGYSSSELSRFKSAFETSPLNIIESNHSLTELDNADGGILQFPHYLAAFIKDLKDLAGWEEAIAWINIGTAAVSGVNVYRSLKSWKFGKMWKKGADKIDADDLWIYLKEGKKGKFVSKKPILKNLLEDKVASLKKTEIEFRAAGEIDKADDILDQIRYHNELLASVVEATDAGTLSTIIKTNEYGGTTKSNYLTEFVDSEWQQIGLSEGEKTRLIELIGANPKAWEKIGTAEYQKPFEVLRDISQGSGFGDVLNIDDVKKLSLFTVPGSGKGPYTQLIDQVLAEEVFSFPGAQRIKGLVGLSDAFRITASGWRKYLQMGSIFFMKFVSGTANWIRIGRIQVYLAFFLQTFGPPQPYYALRGLLLEMSPKTQVVGEDYSYFEIGKLSRTGGTKGASVWPTNFFTNLLEFFNIDLKDIVGEGEAGAIKRKMQNIGDYVVVVDQSHPTGNKVPRNMIFPTTQGGTDKFAFMSLNPDLTWMYGLEHPRAYYNWDKNKYTAIALFVKNVNISGFTEMELEEGGDFATFDFSWFSENIPGSESWITMSLIGGVFNGVLLGRGAVGLMTTIYAGQWFLGAAKDSGSSVGQQRYGEIVDVKKAYDSGKLCKDVRNEEMGKITPLLEAKGVLAFVGGALEVAELAGWAAAVPYGRAIILASQIIVGVSDYIVTEQYIKAKEEGLNRMKNDCYETVFEIFAYKKIPTEQGTMDELTKMFQDTVSGIVNFLGPTIESISPETKATIQQIGQSYYYNTMKLTSRVEGTSLTNFFGTEVYNVHFDKDADIKFMLRDSKGSGGESCKLSICDEVDGEYQCITQNGTYYLYYPDGSLAFEGPIDIHWDNEEAYWSVTQKTVNVIKSDQELMDMYVDRIVIPEGCVKTEIDEQIWGSVDDEKALGNFEAVYTDEAVLWMEDGETAVRFLKDKICGDFSFGVGQIWRISNSHLRLYRNGEIAIVSEDGTEKECRFDLGVDGFISFTNGKIIPGTAKLSEAFNFENVLHIFIHNLITLTPDPSYDWGFTDCVDINGDGICDGFEWMIETGDPDLDARLQEILDMIDGTNIRGINDENIAWGNGEITITYPDGTVTTYYIDQTNPFDPTSGLFNLNNGYQMGMGIDPSTGIPQIQIYQNGEPYGAPIPILWATGLGGSMMYNPETGQISIKNEFPFAINPAFHQYGATASPGLATPGSPPWRGRVGVDVIQDIPQPTNILAQLPWTPSGYELMIFVIILLSSLVLIRVKYSKIEIYKKEDGEDG